jgi:AcrR family transcriptional regulator
VEKKSELTGKQETSKSRAVGGREKILEIALSEFLTVGFVEASITEKSGYSRATIYDIFVSKNGLGVQVLKELISQIPSVLIRKIKI